MDYPWFQGELYKNLKNQPDGRFEEKISAKYISQMADALSYCHSKKVRYFDKTDFIFRKTTLN